MSDQLAHRVESLEVSRNDHAQILTAHGKRFAVLFGENGDNGRIGRIEGDVSEIKGEVKEIRSDVRENREWRLKVAAVFAVIMFLASAIGSNISTILSLFG